MGLITSLVEHEFASKRQEKQLQIEALQHVMLSNMNPENKSKYAEEALKKVGLKGQSRDFLHGMLDKLGKSHAKGAEKSKDGGMPPASGGAGGGIGGFSPVSGGKPTEAAPGKPASKSMFPTAAEEAEELRQKVEAEDQRKIQFQRSMFEEKRRENDIMYDRSKASLEGQEQFLGDQLKGVEQLPIPPEKQQERVMEIGRQLGSIREQREELERLHHGLDAAPPKQAAAATEDIKNIKGSALKGQKDAFGNEVDTGGVYTKGKDGKLYPEAPPPKADAPPKPDVSQEVRDQEAYYKSTGMGDEEAKKMALRDRHKELTTKEKGAEIRVINGAAAIENNKPLPEGHYTPGGPSVANPKGDMTIDVGAWDYITTGHLPFTGFSGGGKGKANAREKMLARAGELLSDLGLSPADLPAVRGSVKADMGALSKVTSMGALIGQFETTLEKNMKVAADLSDKFKRGDVRAYNRVISAFKTGKGDPEALNLAAQLHGVAREWGKIMQGSVSASGVQVSEANAADEFFGKGMSNGQLQSFFQNVIMPDIKNRSEAIQDQKDHLVGNLRKVVQDVKGGGSAAHFSEGSDHWDIPADKVEAFKKAHPNAKAQ